MKKKIYIAILIGVSFVRQAWPMDYVCRYANLGNDQQKNAIIIKQSNDDDRDLAAWGVSDEMLAFIAPFNSGNQTSNKRREIVLSESQWLSAELMEPFIIRYRALLMSISACYPKKSRVHSKKDGSEILGYSEIKRRNAAERSLQFPKVTVGLQLIGGSKPVMLEGSCKKQSKDLLVHIAVLNEVGKGNALYVPEMQEFQGYAVADLFFKSIRQGTLATWLTNENAWLKAIDGAFDHLTKESNNIVLKYMNCAALECNSSPLENMKVNNDLPADTVKQAVYLRALFFSSKQTQKKALQAEEIRRALRWYRNYKDRNQIEAVFPALKETDQEAALRYDQTSGMSEWCE